MEIYLGLYSMACFICEQIEKILKKENPFFVKELETGYVVLGDYQFFKGYALFLCKKHVFELHELECGFKNKFLEEMSLVAEAVYKTFKPKKLNYELLGNLVPHLHWHLFPRHEDDPLPNLPAYLIEKKIRCAEDAKPNEAEIKEMVDRLRKALDKL